MFHVERFQSWIPIFLTSLFAAMLRLLQSLSSPGLDLPILPAISALAILIPLLVLRFEQVEVEHRQAFWDLQVSRARAIWLIALGEWWAALRRGSLAVILIFLPALGEPSSLAVLVSCLLLTAVIFALFLGLQRQSGSADFGLLLTFVYLWLGAAGIDPGVFQPWLPDLFLSGLSPLGSAACHSMLTPLRFIPLCISLLALLFSLLIPRKI